MHDVVTFERAGVRTVAVASEEFVDQGVYQGSALGLKEARKLIALVSHPVSDATAAGMAKKAAEVLPHVIRALESDGPLLPGAEPPRRRMSDLCLAGACPR